MSSFASMVFSPYTILDVYEFSLNRTHRISIDDSFNIKNKQPSTPGFTRNCVDQYFFFFLNWIGEVHDQFELFFKARQVFKSTKYLIRRIDRIVSIDGRFELKIWRNEMFTEGQKKVRSQVVQGSLLEQNASYSSYSCRTLVAYSLSNLTVACSDFKYIDKSMLFTAVSCHLQNRSHRDSLSAIFPSVCHSHVFFRLLQQVTGAFLRPLLAYIPCVLCITNTVVY